MTDEQLVEYMDAGQDRVVADARARFAETVEAVRFATYADNRQYDRWRSDLARRAGQAQEGKTLAELVRDLGGQIKGMQVVRGDFEFKGDEPVQ